MFADRRVCGDPRPRSHRQPKVAAERQEFIPRPEQEALLPPQANFASLKDALGRPEEEIRVRPASFLYFCTRFSIRENYLKITPLIVKRSTKVISHFLFYSRTIGLY